MENEGEGGCRGKGCVLCTRGRGAMEGILLKELSVRWMAAMACNGGVEL